jgi:predicted RNA-binding Zn-ribbon protein involved in translation (DUF1610 family)
MLCSWYALRQRVTETKWLSTLDTATIASLAAEVGTKPPVTQGVIINYVPEASPASAAGLNRWDIIAAIGGKPVKNVKDFLTRTDAPAAGGLCVLTVIRRNLRRADATEAWERLSLNLIPTNAEAAPSPPTPCPLDFSAVKLSMGDPSANDLVVALKNVSGQSIVGLSLSVICFGNDDQPAQTLAFNCQAGVAPGDTYRTALVLADALKVLPEITKVRAAVTKVERADGSCWQAPQGQDVFREARNWGTTPTAPSNNSTGDKERGASMAAGSSAHQGMPATEEVIQFSCSACGQHLMVAARYAGQRAKCRKCQTVVAVPTLGRDGRPGNAVQAGS